MKKISIFLAASMFLLLSLAGNAQSKIGADYFDGKWSVLLKGTPGGDTKLVLQLEKKNDSISGVVLDTAGVEITKITKVELQDTTINLYFTAQGYDVNLLMNRKDEDHVIGSLMSMFDAEGERKKEVKVK